VEVAKLKTTTLAAVTQEVQTWEQLIRNKNSRIKTYKSETRQIRDFLEQNDHDSDQRLFYAHAGVHTGESLITIADGFAANLANATVIPDYVHVVTEDGCTLVERFGSFTTYPKWMASYGSYFGFNKETDDFSGPYHKELEARLRSPVTQTTLAQPVFLVSNCKNDKVYGHFLLQIMPNIFRCREFLASYRPPLVFTYQPSAWQIDIMVTLFPWIHDFTILICQRPTKFASLLIPVNIDEPHMDQEFFNFLRQTKEHESSASTKNIYITRNDASSRRLINESSLLSYLARYEYTAFNMSNLTFEAEISLFKSARKVICISGSHCVNAVFCLQPTKFGVIQSFQTILSARFLLNNFGIRNCEYNIRDKPFKALMTNGDFEIVIPDFIDFLAKNEFL